MEISHWECVVGDVLSMLLVVLGRAGKVYTGSRIGVRICFEMDKLEE